MATGAYTTEAQDAYEQFWPKVSEEMRTMSNADLKFHMKHPELPLARIKKIMKLDEDVKMISTEAPILFAKATEMFIHELTMRAWIHTEDNKRRTLHRNDIAKAITKYDQFDFLIDIAPRDDIKPTIKREDSSVRMVPDQASFSYHFQLAQQHQQALQTSSSSSQQPQHQAPQQVVQQAGASGEVQTFTVKSAQQSPQPQVVRLQPQQMTTPAPSLGGIQIVQQIEGPGGEIQQIPIQLNQQQLQMIRAQMIGGDEKPIVIQTAPIQAQVASSSQQQQQQQTIQLQGGQQVYIQQE